MAPTTENGYVYWVYPQPGAPSHPIFADKGALIKIEVNRTSEDSALSATAYYGVRGCLVDRRPLVARPVQ